MASAFALPVVLGSRQLSQATLPAAAAKLSSKGRLAKVAVARPTDASRRAFTAQRSFTAVPGPSVAPVCEAQAQAPVAQQASAAEPQHHETVLSVGIIGAGLIGGCLLNQLKEQVQELDKRHGVRIHVRGIATGKRLLLEEDVLTSGEWKAKLQAQPVGKADLDEFVAHITGAPGKAVIIDCTASEIVAARYPEWMNRGIHIITPNKKAFSGPLSLFKELAAVRKRSRARLLNETVVGAGLPVLGPLRDLVLAGDRVERVEGVLSGTLSFIFNTFSKAGGEGEARPFSEIVKEARALGYTEPDPRDDLNGMDVARKVVILARECGMDIELDDLSVVNLVPEDFRDTAKVSPEEYLEGIPKFDLVMAEKLADAQRGGEVLRYVGVVDVKGGKASVEMRRYPASHPLASLNGADNMLAFTTSYYTAAQPLVIRGPGAGAAVTAAGVFADLNRLAAYLGAVY